MHIRCPQCRQTLQAPDNAVGRKAQCKGCQTVFVIAAPAAAPAASLRPRMQEAPTCPNCRSAIAPGAVLCVNCGFNLKTGQLPTPVAAPAAPAPPEEEKPTSFERAIVFVGCLMPGLFRPGVVLAAGLLSAVGLGVMAFSLALLAMGTVMAACMVGGLGLLLYAHALAMLLQGEFGLAHELLAELDGRRWWLFFILLFGTFGLFYLLLWSNMPKT